MAKTTSSKTTKKAPAVAKGANTNYLIVTVAAVIALLCAVSYSLFLFGRIEAQANDITRLQENIVQLRRQLDNTEIVE